MHLSAQWLRLLPALGRGSVVVDLLFIGAPIVCGGSVFVLLFSNLCRSIFAIILMGKRELVALL